MKRKIFLILFLICLVQIVLVLSSSNNLILVSKAAIYIVDDPLEVTDNNGVAWSYTLDKNNNASIKPKSINNLPAQLIIPSKVNGYTVTSIQNDAFSRCKSIENVTIPQTVLNIGERAFNYCEKLKNINLPDSIKTIGMFAFSDCDVISSITIPKNTETIDTGVFIRCPNLININVDEENTNFKSIDGVLFSKDGTKLIAYPGGKEEKAYTINSGVTNLCDLSFSYCYNLETINISDTVKNINFRMITSTDSLKEINVDERNEYFKSIDGVLFNKNMTILIRYPASKTITEYNIPTTVTMIGDYAFENCKNLTRITIPNSVTNIGRQVFDGCENLLTIQLPDGLEAIEPCMFNNCKKINNIVIPESVKEIGYTAFMGCESLSSIKIPYGIEKIEKYTFRGCKNLERVEIPDTVIKIEKTALDGCNKAKYYNYNKDGKVNETSAIKGDVNGDGNISFSDMLAINIHRLGKENIKGVYLIVADINNDGEANFTDMLRINKYRLGKTTSL